MNAAAPVRRILVGVDFDDASAAALQAAGTLAMRWHADITVFHATAEQAPVYFTTRQIEAIESEQAENRSGIAQQLRAFAARHLIGAFTVIVGEAPAADALIRAAANFDLIVVGTHRRHGASRWWLGSVAEAVVRRSPCPVLVVPTMAGVADASRKSTILAAGTGDAFESWIDALKPALNADVVRADAIGRCAPDRVQHADVIVLTLPAADHMREAFGAIVQVLKECVHPVLFVPPDRGTVERRSS